MTEVEVAAIEALANAATPGPWAQNVTKWGGDDVMTVTAPSAFGAMVVQEPTEFSVYPSGAWVTPNGKESDMAFIAASREAIPALVAEVRRLRALVREAYEEGQNTTSDDKGYRDSQPWGESDAREALGEP